MTPLRRRNIGSAEPATKGDLEELREDLHVDLVNAVTGSERRLRSEILEVEKRLRAEMEAIEKRIDEKLDLLLEKIEGLIENRSIELGAAKREHVDLLDDRVNRLDERVAVLERSSHR